MFLPSGDQVGDELDRGYEESLVRSLEKISERKWLGHASRKRHKLNACHLVTSSGHNRLS